VLFKLSCIIFGHLPLLAEAEAAFLGEKTQGRAVCWGPCQEAFLEKIA